MKTIPLTKGLVALVDDGDYEKVSVLKWHAHTLDRTAYAAHSFPDGTNRQKKVMLHRLLLNALPGEFVDHIDGNGLNCQRANMRKCTLTENNRNRRVATKTKSGFKGVLETPYGRWRSVIYFDYKTVHLGTFSTAIEAAKAYNRAALKAWGAFARLNDVE